MMWEDIAMNILESHLAESLLPEQDPSGNEMPAQHVERNQRFKCAEAGKIM